jgi:uncharacterized protein with NRDE domain
MCTLIVLDRVVPRSPLVVASNRDEYLARPAAPPARIEPAVGDLPPFVAPQDLEAGGTWMGVNAHGLFAGLTNRPTDARRPERRSRGLLVMDALRHERASDAAHEMQQLRDASYNPFNLYLADGRESFVTTQREDSVETEALRPGVHVLCNRDLDDLGVPKIARIHEALGRLDLEGPVEAIMEGLADLLRSHTPARAPLEATCIHTAAYGTRSSTILALGPDRWRYWHADGPPCSTKYRNLAKLLDELQ